MEHIVCYQYAAGKSNLFSTIGNLAKKYPDNFILIAAWKIKQPNISEELTDYLNRYTQRITNQYPELINK